MSDIKSFSKRAAVRFGWETTKANFWFVVGVYLTVMVVGSLASIFVETRLVVENSSAFWLLNAISWVLGLITSMGLIKISLALHDGGEFKYSDLFTNYQRFFRVLGASILIGIIVVIGFVLLIVPGFILALRLQFTMFLIIDEDLGITDAIKKSWEITRGSAGNLFLFWLLSILIIIVGLIALIVGLLVAGPVVWLGMTYIYRQLNPGQPADTAVANSSPVLFES